MGMCLTRKRVRKPSTNVARNQHSESLRATHGHSQHLHGVTAIAQHASHDRHDLTSVIPHRVFAGGGFVANVTVTTLHRRFNAPRGNCPPYRTADRRRRARCRLRTSGRACALASHRAHAVVAGARPAFAQQRTAGGSMPPISRTAFAAVSPSLDWMRDSRWSRDRRSLCCWWG